MFTHKLQDSPLQGEDPYRLLLAPADEEDEGDDGKGEDPDPDEPPPQPPVVA